MRPARYLAYGLVLSLAASAAEGVVRVVVIGGKKVITNDGIGEPAAGGERLSGGWSAARVAAPSRFDDLIAAAAREHALDPRLVKSVMLFESGFNPKAVSRKGARGLMQLMPRTAAQHGVRNVHDPAQNVEAGARHLSYLLDLYRGNLEKTLAAYNAGEAAVERYGGVPPYEETRGYVSNILGAYNGRSDMQGRFGRSSAPAFRSSKGRPVRVVRDANDRVLLTTGKTPAQVAPASRRLG
ncbi:MAG TPA: lytic transglycosylase domain-containing protein [Thermoanaerobaculia bacterium]|nr:lytic transglycosylase domain-containing protein [Thermoanaerobaculia bacterium]